MKFRDIYQDAHPFRYSVEVFPPKTPQGTHNLYDELERLKAIDPAYVSVTYGAMGSSQALTKEITVHVKKELNLNAAFHFTCVGSDKKTIRDYVQSMIDEGIELVVALRGDIPQGQDEFKAPQNGFAYANELIEYIHSLHSLSIAAAAYPEKHIEAESFATDLQNLKRKADAGAEILITQLFFDNEDYFSFLERARAIGITQPILPGILPVQSLNQVERFTSLCGAKFPDPLHEALESCRGNNEKMIAVGIEHASHQCRDLIQRGVPGIHFFSLNKADAVLEIVKNCSDLV